MTPEEQKENALNQLIQAFIADIKSAGAGAHIICVSFEDIPGEGAGRTVMDGPSIIIAAMVEKLAASLNSEIFLQLLAHLACDQRYAEKRGETFTPVDPKKVN
jgi:hypothetical protein